MSADKFSAEVTGLDELEQALNELLPKAANTAMRRASRAAGDLLIEDIEQRAPEFTGFMAHHIVETARTKDNTIVVKIGPQKDAGYFRAGQGSEHHLEFTGKAHMADQAARFREFGTVHEPAQPFMGPAMEERAQDMVDIFAAELREEIEKAKK
jgi:HK97 gp10 family phage protein